MILDQLKIAVTVLLTALVLAQSGFSGQPAPAPTLVPDRPDALQLSAELVKSLNLRTAVAKPATQVLLPLTGVLALQPDGVVCVHTPCPGEVGELGKVAEPSREGTAVFRPLRILDRVKKGDLLAVISSKEMLEKKSDLIDSLVQLQVAEAELARVEKQYNKEGAATETMLRQAAQRVVTSRGAVVRVERLLRLWRVTQEELRAVQEEAERLSRRAGKREPEKESGMGRVEVRAPHDGTILENNVTLGQNVGTTTTLFKVADLGKLMIQAEVPEANLPALATLPPQRRHWSIALQSDAESSPLEGTIEALSPIVDPKTSLGQAIGSVDNPNGSLRIGQKVFLKVFLPPAPDTVEVPSAAVVEEGGEAFVFVQVDPKELFFGQRRVSVAWRSKDVIHVRSRSRPDEERQGLKPLLAGERVVIHGTVELRTALQTLQAKEKRGRTRPSPAGTGATTSWP
jgi:cobalt-zinc-cadmium efflux system membrane fusion protein